MRRLAMSSGSAGTMSETDRCTVCKTQMEHRQLPDAGETRNECPNCGNYNYSRNGEIHA